MFHISIYRVIKEESQYFRRWWYRSL